MICPGKSYITAVTRTYYNSQMNTIEKVMVKLITTVQQIMMGLRMTETEVNRFSLTVRAVYDLVM
jgi:hypothetical protein